MTIHYRWHPCFGQRLRCYHRVRRPEGDFIHVEVRSGVVLLVPNWMTDPAACVGMDLQAPRVGIVALLGLKSLLNSMGITGPVSYTHLTLPTSDLV